MIRILSLCDNIVDDKNCWAAEGLSLLISVDNITILFDTGRSIDVLLHNTMAKGIDIKTVNYIVLSHGHKGHMGAIQALLPYLGNNTIIVFGKRIENQKYKVVDGESTLDSSINNEDVFEKIKARGVYIEVDKTFQMSQNVTILADIPIVSDELTGFSPKYMVVSDAYHEMDLFAEELALCLILGDHILIISGCAHRGINNIVTYAQSLYPNKKVYGIVGGLHMKNNVRKTEILLAYIRTLDIKMIAPCHCTGIFSKALIRNAFPELCQELSTGMVLEIEYIGGDSNESRGISTES